MDNGFTFHWSMIIYILAALVYFELMRRLDRRWANRTPLSDEEILWNHARANEISELEVFRRAAVAWSVATAQAEEDFDIYVTQGDLPHYVRYYLRKLKPGFKVD